MTAASTHHDLKMLLLDMISTSRPVDVERTANLNAEDWKILTYMAEQHRLEPLLHHHSQIYGEHWIIPNEERSVWNMVYRQSALRTLKVQQTLERAGKILSQAGIDYAALKGAWLANYAYPHPALRPMRDIDILVGIEDAVRAFELLLSEGFKRDEKDISSLKYYLENTKDMPILYDSKTGIKFEIHFHVTHTDSSHHKNSISDTESLLSRIIVKSSNYNDLYFLNPTDTLLHIIVHSVYDHKFNNGPLILNDISYLILNYNVEWDYFWKMAEVGNFRKGCDIMFELTSFYHSEVRDFLLNSIGSKIPDDILKAASLSMLQDFEESSTVSLRAEISSLTSFTDKLSFFWRRAFPEREVLASFAGLDSDSKAFWLGYPKWAFTRAQYFLFRKVDDHANEEIKNQIFISKWLSS